MNAAREQVEAGIEMDNQIRNMIGHESAARHFAQTFHQQARLRGWWNDPKTKQPLDIAVPLIAMKLLLIHSEISEATEGLRKDTMDDHLPHRTSLETEMADAVIRIFDLAGALDLDIVGAMVEKAQYNAQRLDHDPSRRAEANGKSF